MPPPPLQFGTPKALPNESKVGFLNWWQSIMLALSSALAGVVFVVLVQRGAGGGETPTPSVLFRYVPHFLMLFGVLADAFTYQGVYWTGTAAGIFGAIGAPVLERIISGVIGIVSSAFGGAGRRLAGATAAEAAAAAAAASAQAAKDSAPQSFAQDGSYDGCTFAGNSTTTSSVPQMLIVTSTILWYYTVDLIDNRGATGAIGTLISFLALYGAQYVAIKRCITPAGGSTMNGALMGLVYGLVLGGVFYSVMKAFGPQFLPSSVITAVSRGTSGGAVDSNGVALNTNADATLGTGAAPTSCASK